MKKSDTIFLLLVFFTSLAIDVSYAQRTADLSIENAHASGSYYTWEIHITPTSDWGTGNRKALGNCSWYFSYNTSALNNPVLTFTAPQVATSAGYTNSTGLVSNKVQVTTYLDTDNYDGVNLDQGTNYHIYTVRMDINDTNQEANLYWDETNTGIFNARDQSVDETYIGNGDISLPVELFSFIASSAKGHIILQWVTQSETDNLGFNIYRSIKANGPFHKINNELVRGAGNSVSERQYKYVDDGVEENKNYYYKLEDINTQGKSKYHGPIQIFVEKTEIPDKFNLDQNYPNPFNPSTIIQYGLPVDTQVKLRIYNVRGELIRLLVNTEKSAGVHQVEWDGRNDNGMRVPTGLYFYKIETRSFTDIKKLIFTK